MKLAIKSWNLLDADSLRARYDSPVTELWLYGKSLYALPMERRLAPWATAGGGSAADIDVVTPWKLVQKAVAPWTTGGLSWDESRWGASIEVMTERPRWRQLQQLPEAVCLLLYRADPIVEPPWEEIWEERKAA